jgi:hypothetical protein
MRVSCAACVFVVVAAVPSASRAAAIPFDVTPGVASIFAGEFENLNDVALFQFTLIEGGGAFNFLATTDSIAAGGGFDSELTLYLGDQLYTYLDEFGVPTFAKNDDSPSTPSGVDASLSLLLTTPGIYTLALAHTQNASHETFGFDWDGIADVMGELYRDVSCDPGGPTFGPFCANATFSVEVSVTPVATEPLPEPSTISLLAVALGALAIRRRRRGTLL